VRTIPKTPSAIGLASRLAYAHARARGIPVRPLLKRAGLSAAHLDDPRARIAVCDQIEFLNLVADELGDDLLGLQLASGYELRMAGLLYYVFASSDTLREVFERGARYSAVINEGELQTFVDGRHAGLAIRYAGVRRQEDRHQIEFWVVSLLRMCRKLTGKHLRPVRVRLTHFRGHGQARLSRFVGCRVEFGAATDEILFAREALQLRVMNADGFLNRLLLDVCEQALARRRPADSFAALVENTMAPLLPHGRVRAGELAARLGVSPRTFARRLAGEGLTFSRLLQRMRLELARRLIEHERLAVSKVAWLLGYTEVGAFSHAFRRWTGESPSQVARRAGTRGTGRK
jgi:AraC-like DNA-binding protein